MYEQGFRDYKLRQVLCKGQALHTLAVVGGEEVSVSLVADADFSFSMSDEEEVTIRFSPKEFVFAPVAEGAEAGFAYIFIGDKQVGQVLLRYDRTIELQPEQKQHFWQRWFGE